MAVHLIGQWKKPELPGSVVESAKWTRNVTQWNHLINNRVRSLLTHFLSKTVMIRKAKIQT